MRPFHYVEHSPGVTARDVALTYSCFTVRELPAPDFQHRIWPDGCVSVTFVCAGPRVHVIRLLGVFTSATDVPVHAGARYWTIRFRPETGASWAGVTAAELRDQNLDARVLLGADVERTAAALPGCDTDEQVIALFDQLVASRALATPVDAVVRRAVSEIVQRDGRRPITAIAADLGVSVRLLQRRFLRVVGLTPKEYSSIRRGREALKRVVFGDGPEADGWSGIALATGFSDQSHMSREFARLTRFAPRALQSRLDSIDHGRIVD